MQGKQIGKHCQLQVYTTKSTEARGTQHYYPATDHLNDANLHFIVHHNKGEP